LFVCLPEGKCINFGYTWGYTFHKWGDLLIYNLLNIQGCKTGPGSMTGAAGVNHNVNLVPEPAGHYNSQKTSKQIPNYGSE